TSRGVLLFIQEASRPMIPPPLARGPYGHTLATSGKVLRSAPLRSAPLVQLHHAETLAVERQHLLARLHHLLLVEAGDPCPAGTACGDAGGGTTSPRTPPPRSIVPMRGRTLTPASCARQPLTAKKGTCRQPPAGGYFTARGFRGEPTAPTTLSGGALNRNSHTPSCAQSAASSSRSNISPSVSPMSRMQRRCTGRTSV